MVPSDGFLREHEMKRHDLHEVSAKLRLADDMMRDGKSQKDACKSLGISVMTFHRWRKLATPTESFPLLEEKQQGTGANGVDHSIIDDLTLENHRLRRIVSDLLLEKMKIQEALDKTRK
jgi:putative transposase